LKEALVGMLESMGEEAEVALVEGEDLLTPIPLIQLLLIEIPMEIPKLSITHIGTLILEALMDLLVLMVTQAMPT
jgi:hypothetical protein